jgi:hypothetical protein
MNDSRNSFGEQDAKRVLGSKEGQELIRLLNRDGGKALREAASALQSGDAEQAKRLLSPVMDTAEASALVDRLSRR